MNQTLTFTGKTTPPKFSSGIRPMKQYFKKLLVFIFRGAGDVDLPKDVLNSLTRFQRKQRKGTIDVWWLYDDGGTVYFLIHASQYFYFF